MAALVAIPLLTGQQCRAETPELVSALIGRGVFTFPDRARPFRTKLPVNRPYLDRLSVPPPAAALTASFARLADLQARGLLPRLLPPPARGYTCLLLDPDPRHTEPCSARMLEGPSATARRGTSPRPTGGTATAAATAPPTDPAELVARWRRADQQAVFADDARSARPFLRLAHDYPDHFLGQLALLEAAGWQHRVGRDDGPEGAAALLTLLAERSLWLRTQAQQGLAELAFSRGDYSQARGRYEALLTTAEVSAGDRLWMEYRLAQLDEFAGDWAQATAHFERCAKAEDKTLAAEAGYALKRLEALQSKQPVVAQTPQKRREDVVRYLGEDRATQGDWHTRYGHEAFILCAQQAPQDVAGGSLGGWQVIPTVGSATEKTRYWVTDASEDNRSYLFNPLSKVRRAANWDDRGEQYPLGTGPDLLLDVPVPPGEHVLSLYFVNDRNYYEPNRVYTISVWDESGAYQTGAEVRSFIRGTYYRFAVNGPRRLQFRLWRNLAVNLIFAGLFLDKPGAPPLWPAQVPLWAPHKTTVTLPQPRSGRPAPRRP